MRVLTMLLAFSIAAVAADSAELGKIRTIYVKSTGPEGVKVRQMLEKRKTCFSLARNADDADAILDLTGESQLKSGVLGEHLDIRSNEVTGVLSTKEGDYLWSRSERFEDAPFMNGRKVAAEIILKVLNKQAGCKGNRRK
jgi:hypothetical protein